MAVDGCRIGLKGVRVENQRCERCEQEWWCEDKVVGVSQEGCGWEYDGLEDKDQVGIE